MTELNPVNKEVPDFEDKPEAMEMSTEEAFEALTDDLSVENKAEFFKTLREAGIKKDDRVLLKFLRALQLYKSFYSEIPQSVKKAAVRMGRIRDEVEKMADRVAGDSADIHESLDNIYSRVGEAADKSSRRIVNNIEKTLEPLSDAVKRALPSQLADLEKANKVFSKTVKTSKQASAELQKNIKYMQWQHYRAFTLSVFFVILGLWAFIHFRYESRLDAARTAIASQFEANQDILLELAKANRRLELTTDNKGSKLLSVRNAKGWNSTDNRGVIEFK